MRFECPLAASARRHPRAPALVWPDGQHDYATLSAKVAEAAGSLSAAGVRAGARVALLHDPTPALIVRLFALWRLGAVAVPLSLRASEAQIPAMLETVGADALIADRPVAQTVAPLLHLTPAPSVKATRIDPAAIATAVFTSGSSGVPKAIEHTVANHVTSARGANLALDLRAGDRWLLSLPLYHVGGLAVLWRCFATGATVCLPAGLPLAESLSALAITHLSVVPTQLRRLLADATPRGALRTVLCGGDGTPPGLLAAAREAGWPAFGSYGCTEAASVVTMTGKATAEAWPTGSGRILPGRRLRITDDGEIALAGKVVAPFRREANRQTPLAGADGWYRTGDLGHLDDDGTLHVTGRKDRQFISGGENLHPEAIEAAISDLPGVAQAVVIAVPDAVYGRRPLAFVHLNDGTAPSLDSLRDRLAQQGRLPKIAWPDHVFPLPTVAGVPAMKPDRRALAAHATHLVATRLPNSSIAQATAPLFTTTR